MSKHLPNFPFLDAGDLQSEGLFKKRVERGVTVTLPQWSQHPFTMVPQYWNEINTNIYV